MAIKLQGYYENGNYFLGDMQPIPEGRVGVTVIFHDVITAEMIREKLAESEREAADPNCKWLSHEEVFGKFRERLGYEI